MSAQLTMVDVITLATIQQAVTAVPVVLVTVSLLMDILVMVRCCSTEYRIDATAQLQCCFH